MPQTKILIVDDSATALHYFSEQLTSLGYQPVCASNAREALSLLELEKYDMVLSDLIMPEMDGLDLLKEIKARSLDVPFLLITSYGSLATAVQAVREGADDYILRPVDTQLLAHRLATVLERQQMLEEKAHRLSLEAALATAGGAAHELNQPLTAIMASAELLQGSDSPEQMRDLAKVIAKQSERLGKITHRLVRLVRFQTKAYVGDTVILDLQASSEEPRR